MRDQKHAALIIAVCIGLFSFLTSLIISKYGSEMLVMGVGLFSIALVSISLMLLWRSMAEVEVKHSEEFVEETGPANVQVTIEDSQSEILEVHEPKNPEAQNIEL